MAAGFGKDDPDKGQEETMQLGDIQRHTKTVTIPFDQQELVIEYLPAVMTSKEFAQAMTNLPTTLDQLLDIVIPWLEKAIVWWDIYDGDSPLAVSAESLKQLPVNVLMQILQAISRFPTDPLVDPAPTTP